MIFAFLNAVSLVSILHLPLYLSSHLSYSIYQIGLAVSAVSIGQMIGSFISGKLSQWMSKQTLIYTSLIVIICCNLCLYIIANFSYFMLTLAVMGLSSGLLKPYLNFYILQSSPEADKARINGLYRLIINIGVGVAGLIGGIISTFEYNLIFVISALLTMTACFFNFLLKPFRDASESPKTKQQKQNKSVVASKPIKEIILLLCIVVLNNLVFGQLGSNYPIYLEQYFSMSALTFGYLITFNTVLIILLQVPLLSYLKKYNNYLVTSIGSLLLCSSMLPLLIGEHWGLVIISVTMWTLGEIIALSCVFALFFNLNNNTNADSLAWYYATIALSASVAPILGSWLYPFFHGALLWGACSGFGILNCIILLYLAKFKRG